MAKHWTRETYAEHIRQLEEIAERDPIGYRRRIILFIALGYAIVGIVLVLALLSLSGLALILASGKIHGGVIKLLIIVGVFTAGLLRALWVRIPPPEGVPLSRDDAPELFDAIERLRRKLDAPTFRRVLLDGDFNAAAAQRPRLGLFGWYENNLILGLPLMLALSPEQFESVIAHELGHFRGGHGKLGVTAGRVNATWERIALEGLGGGILRGFANWYGPRLDALSFPLRRRNEYEADRAAAEATSPEVAAAALCGLHTRNAVVQKRVWDGLEKELQRSPRPPEALYARIQEALQGDAAEPATLSALTAALTETTGIGDTHPALADRLQALGQEPAEPPAPVSSAADRFLGDALPRLSAALSRQWAEIAAPAWISRHAEAKEEAIRLQTLEEAAALRALTEDERWELAHLTESVRDGDVAEPLYRTLIAESVKPAYARFALGRLLAERDEIEAESLLTEAAERDPELALPALATLRQLRLRRGNREAVAELESRLNRAVDHRDAAQEEIDRLDPNCAFAPHGLAAEETAAMRSALESGAELGRAYLVRRVLSRTQQPRFLLVVTRRKKMIRVDETADWKKLFDELPDRLPMIPGLIQTVPAHGDLAWLEGAVQKIPGSLVFERK